MPDEKNVLEKILKTTQIAAIVWAALTVVIYLGVYVNLITYLRFGSLADLLVFIEYSGIWGAPVLSAVSMLLLLIVWLRKKSLAAANKKLTVAAAVFPVLAIVLLMLYELNAGEILS